MSKFAKRKDTNHNELKAYLIAKGCDVVDMYAVGQGVPDLLVSYNGEDFWIEVKYLKGKQTDSQIEFLSKHKTLRYFIARNKGDIDEILASASRATLHDKQS